MDWKKVFSEPHRIHITYDDIEFVHHVREMTHEEFLGYRRRLSMMAVDAKGRMRETPDTIAAPIWAYDQICIKVTAENAEGVIEELPDFKTIIPPDIKVLVIAAWERRCQLTIKIKKEDKPNADI